MLFLLVSYVIQHLLDLLARAKTKVQTFNETGIKSLLAVRAFAGDANGIRTELAQTDNFPLCQMFGNDLQQRFDHRHHIRRADGGDRRDILGELP